MSLKHVAIAFALLLVLAITWRLAQSEWAQGLGQRAGEISDTNSFCPPGTRELKLEKGTVNVVGAGPAAAHAA